MKRLFLAMISTLLGVLLIGTALASQEDEQTKISNGKLVNTLRLLNTNEMSYRNEKGRFADREELLEFLKTKNLLSKSPIDLQNPEAYKLAITTTPDGTHYQITLRRAASNQNAECATAAFSDNSGLIYLGSVIGCASGAR